MDEFDPEPDTADARGPGVRAALSPRALVVTAVVIAVVALGVVLLGARAPSASPVGGAAAGGSSGAGSSGAGSSVGGSSVVGATPLGAGSATALPSDGAGGAGGRNGGAGSSATSAPVVVHVAGAVARAGVYALPPGSRVQDAVDAAGGAVEGADTDRVNLARALVDGEQVYLPRIGEDPLPQVLGGGAGTAGVPAGGGAAGSGGEDVLAVVDLNTADQSTLETLPGIGPALAARILAWRTEHGGFSSVEDLLDVSGIGDARFADLEPRVRV